MANEMSIAVLNPSTEQSEDTALQIGFKAKAMECSRKSSFPALGDFRKTASNCDSFGYVERQENRRVHLHCQRLYIGFCFFILVGDGEFRALRVKGLTQPQAMERSLRLM